METHGGTEDYSPRYCYYDYDYYDYDYYDYGTGRPTGRAWQEHGRSMAGAWQEHGRSLAGAWQEHDSASNCLCSRWHFAMPVQRISMFRMALCHAGTRESHGRATGRTRGFRELGPKLGPERQGDSSYMVVKDKGTPGSRTRPPSHQKKTNLLQLLTFTHSTPAPAVRSGQVRSGLGQARSGQVRSGLGQVCGFDY